MVSKSTKIAIDNAYKWILGRNADENGLRDYGQAIERGELEEAGLRRILLECAEFQNSEERSFRIVEIEHDLRAVIHSKDKEFGVHISQYGTWETHIVSAIRTHLNPGDTFVDVGANLGLMSFHAAQVVGPEGKVIAFEPNPRNVSCNRRGIAANGFGNIILYPLGVSNSFRMLTTTTASNAKVIADANALTTNDVGQAVPLDFILRGEERVDLIKMDIEGYELPAFEGMDATLRQHRPLVLTEFNPLCLRSQGEIDPIELAEHIFTTTKTVEIVEHDGSSTTVESAGDLMNLWAIRDREAASAGWLPPGWVHFDLLFRAY